MISNLIPFQYFIIDSITVGFVNAIFPPDCDFACLRQAQVCTCLVFSLEAMGGAAYMSPSLSIHYIQYLITISHSETETLVWTPEPYAAWPSTLKRGELESQSESQPPL